MSYIDTEKFSVRLRSKSINPFEKKILIAQLSGSEQEKDFSTPTNCRGYGRIRHFKLDRYPDWSANPLPILPALNALGVPLDEVLRAQVFQNAACNWRCWYCYVDFDRLSANYKVSSYFTAVELIEMYLAQENRPDVIDLSGGQPDLTPEWLLWMMEALEEKGLKDKIFLWSDDNLSNKYFWEFLNRKQRTYITAFPKYARVGCFKGYDETSFSFNTEAHPNLFDQQFEIFKQLIHEGIDMYAYVTFTAIPHNNVAAKMKRFVDKLQDIHPNLPLRTIPLKVEAFTPTQRRLKKQQEKSLSFQYEVHKIWVEELHTRFLLQDINEPIYKVKIR
jgi:uncharacterized Fe-S cluster-containing radical SAM superfamily protein